MSLCRGLNRSGWNCQSGGDLLGDGSVQKHIQEEGTGSYPEWGDKVTINILIAEIGQGLPPKWICSQLSYQYTIGFGTLLPREVGDAALRSMRANEKATFSVDVTAMQTWTAGFLATWLFKDDYERVDVERYCLSIEVLEIKASPVVDLWQDALGIVGHGLTMRRPITQLQATSETTKQSLSPSWWNAGVLVEIEICDCTGHVTVPSSQIRCVQGDGDLPDAVELSLLCLQPGQSCEVCCRASLSTELAKPSNPPVLFRIWLISRSDIEELNGSTAFQGLSNILRHARCLLKQKRFLLALLKLRSLRNTQLPSKKLNEESLRLLCLCGHHLNLAAAKQWADQLVECSVLAQHLILRARVRLSSQPARALRDLKTAFELDGASVGHNNLVTRAKQQLKRQRRAAQWFDGQDADERTLKASSKHICYQCNRLRKNGRFGTSGSNLEGKYLCNECWRCWSAIRRSQQMELDRRLEKATYSDYSTATDELPSLDERPQDWDSHHPMWKRVNTERPGWQHEVLHEDLNDHPGSTAAWPALAAPKAWTVVD